MIRLLPLLLAVPAAQHPDSTLQRIRSSPAAWVAACLLMIVALYYLIRIMEWDQVNKETPNQEDPLLK